MKDYQNFLGSYLALVLGLFSILGGMTDKDMLAAGWYMVLGSLAYMSAKKRKMGMVSDSIQRKTFELIAIAIIFMLVLYTNREDMIEQSFHYVVLPAWAIIAYIVAFTKSTSVKVNVEEN